MRRRGQRRTGERHAQLPVIPLAGWIEGGGREAARQLFGREERPLDAETIGLELWDRLDMRDEAIVDVDIERRRSEPRRALAPDAEGEIPGVVPGRREHDRRLPAGPAERDVTRAL